MSNIIILVGSERKNGNTTELSKSFMKGASINNKVEMISVSEYKVNSCTGCNCCLKNMKCVQNDDMQKIYEKLNEADIVVIASPVYFYGISSQLKAIVDRLHNPLRNTFNVKKLGLFLVGGAGIPNLFDAIKLQYQMILSFFTLEDIGQICVSSVREIGEIKNTKALEQAYELGLSIK